MKKGRARLANVLTVTARILPGALLGLTSSRFFSSCRRFLCATPWKLCSSTPLRGA